MCDIDWLTIKICYLKHKMRNCFAEKHNECAAALPIKFLNKEKTDWEVVMASVSEEIRLCPCECHK